jgi:hypothetical protein
MACVQTGINIPSIRRAYVKENKLPVNNFDEQFDLPKISYREKDWITT